MGLTQEQADYLAEIWMGRNGALASLRRARNAGNAGNSGSGSSLADTLSESLLLKAGRGADAAVEYIAAQLASGAIGNEFVKMISLIFLNLINRLKRNLLEPRVCIYP